jgi:hypothetical protein
MYVGQRFLDSRKLPNRAEIFPHLLSTAQIIDSAPGSTVIARAISKGVEQKKQEYHQTEESAVRRLDMRWERLYSDVHEALILCSPVAVKIEILTVIMERVEFKSDMCLSTQTSPMLSIYHSILW